MKKVSGPEVVTTVEASESPLPAEIQQALGELVGAAREGLLALSVGLGLSVVHELMEREVDEVVGPKGKHDADRTAKRHGHEDGSMTLGGRRAAVCRPRMRTADDEHELPVSTYGYFADRDPLTRAVMDRMLAGVSTRRFASVGEPVGEEVEQASSATGKSTVSELFIECASSRACSRPFRCHKARPGNRKSASTSARLSQLGTGAMSSGHLLTTASPPGAAVTASNSRSASKAPLCGRGSARWLSHRTTDQRSSARRSA